MRGADGGWGKKKRALRDGEKWKNTNYHRELDKERKTDGENGWRRGGLEWWGWDYLYCPCSCNRGSVVAVWKKRPQCGAAESPNSMDVQTGGCYPCTLGPVLNAGGVVQSQKS